MNTVTSAIQAGDFSQAISLASDLMPGNQPIQDALTACENAQADLSQKTALALSIAAGN